MKTTLLLGCTLVLGAATALAGDDEKKAKPAYGKTKAAKWEKTYLNEESKAELVALFNAAMGSCCAEATCEEPGGCMAPCDGCETGECTEWDHTPPSSKLVKMVSKHTDALAAVQPMLEETFLAEGATASQRELILEVLAYSEGKDSAACTEKLYRAAPASFSPDHLIAFAPRSEVFENDLAKLAKKGQVRPAAYFAIRGKKEPSELSKHSFDILVQAADAKSVCCCSTGDAFVAATVLKQLGQPQYLLTVRERARGSALSALDDGNVEGARAVALQAEFFGKNGAWYGGTESLSYLGRQMKTHCQARSKEVATADQVFALIEQI